MSSDGPAFAALMHVCQDFPGAAGLSGDCEPIPPDGLPHEARALLAHERHMTAVLTEAVGSAPELRILALHSAAAVYARQVLLVHHQAPIELAIVRVRLSSLPAACIQAVLRGVEPLGQILTRENVRRQVQPLHYFRFDPRHPLSALLARGERPLYGRVGQILCNDLKAVDMLEMVDADAIMKITRGRSRSLTDPAG